ncbi:MAG: hypothetical protein ACQET6_14010 [Bacillota bacterium]
MNQFKAMPKSIKKAIRYIYQDASKDQLIDLKTLFNQAIDKRMKEQRNSHK